jgi:hypothetical protein
MKAKIASNIFIGLLSIAVFWNLSGNSFEETSGLTGALYFGCMQSFMQNLMISVLVF